MEAKLSSNSLFKLAAVAVLAFALALVALAQPAFADESSSAAASDSAASAESGKPAEADSARGGLPMMGGDYVWFGRELDLSNSAVENDLIAAGQVVNIKKTTVAGDFRTAAQDIAIKDSFAGQNITAAGETVAVNNSTAKAIALAGRTAYFSGTCDELTMYAETVYIDGTVNGDVVVGANTVEIRENAHITGTLRVSASSEPVIKSGAEVGKVEFTQSEDRSATAGGASAVAAFGNGMIELWETLAVFLAIMSILGTLVVAVLAEWLFRRQTAGAAEMIRTRTGATIGSGIIGALVAPLAVILLIVFGITLPVAGGVAFTLFAMTSVATGFVGASLFKLAFKKLGRFQCALAGGAIMGVASAIPFLGSIVGALSFMYLLGYVLQSIYLGMRDPAPGSAPTIPAE